MSHKADSGESKQHPRSPAPHYQSSPQGNRLHVSMYNGSSHKCLSRELTQEDDVFPQSTRRAQDGVGSEFRPCDSVQRHSDHKMGCCLHNRAYRENKSFETGSCIVQADFQLLVLLPQPPRYCDQKPASPSQSYFLPFKFMYMEGDMCTGEQTPTKAT